MFEYSNKRTILSELGLPSKTLLFFSFMVLAIVFTDPIILSAVLAICIVLCKIAGINLKSLLNYLKFMLTIFFFLFLFSAFTYNIGNVRHWYAKYTFFVIYEFGDFATIALTSGGILFGLGFAIKIMIMMFASSLLTATSRIEELFLGLEKLGLPYQFGLMMMIAIRFIPTLTREAEQIQQAQRVRGAVIRRRGKFSQTVKGVIPIFVPMIVSSMRRVNTMAMSMTSRGYGYTTDRTQLTGIRFRFDDLIFIVMLVLCVAILIYLRSINGLGLL